jgi:integrase
MNGFEIHLRRIGIKSEKNISAHCNRLKKILPYEKEKFTQLLSTLNPPSINKFCQTARHWCDFKEIKYFEKDFKQVTETNNPRVTMSDEEIMKFLALPSRQPFFWKVLAFQGCRPNEVCKLTVNDVDLSTKSLIIKNTSNVKKGRIIAIHPMIEAEFVEFMKHVKTHYLFPPRGKDQPRSTDSILQEFKVKKGILGIVKDITPYSLRHSLATRLLNNKAGLFSIQDIYGHSSSDTTKIYYRGNLEAQRQALEKDTIYQAKNPHKGIVDLWEELRAKLLNIKVDREKINAVETKLFECLS